jgi:hypothetical protein
MVIEFLSAATIYKPRTKGDDGREMSLSFRRVPPGTAEFAPNAVGATWRSAAYAVAGEPTAPTEQKTLNEKVIVRETGKSTGPQFL